MGTLQNQEPRKNHFVYPTDIDDKVKELKKIALANSVSFEDVVKIATVLELKRKNDLYHSNGDIWDEQMSGIGEILTEMVYKIGTIADSLEHE